MDSTDRREAPRDLPAVAVVMAGGRGQRFWPLSTPEKPKQFLDLERSGTTLLQATVARVAPIVGGLDNVLVATGEAYASLVQEQVPDLPEANLLIEPVGRDSAPAIALAALTVRERYGDVLMGVFASDHRIGDVPAFHAVVERAFRLAASERGLVTIGLEPDRPATGYGYLELGAEVGEGHRVAAFTEKPSRRRAESYLASGRHLWNAGMFVWPVDTILAELDAHAPDLMRPLRTAYRERKVSTAFATLPKISIDYAVMEKSDRTYVVRGDFGWDDIGDWVALERLLPKDDGGTNTVVGQHVGHDASGNIVYTHDPEDVVVTLGAHDLVVVKKGDTVLIADKSRTQDVKKLLEDERLLEILASAPGGDGDGTDTDD